MPDLFTTVQGIVFTDDERVFHSRCENGTEFIKVDQELVGKEKEKVGKEKEKEELMEQVSRMVAILIIC